jgi:hypothetical protein
MAGEGFALEKFNQAAVGIPATERSMKGKDFPKKGKFFPIGTNRDRRALRAVYTHPAAGPLRLFCYTPPGSGRRTRIGCSQRASR